MASTLTLWGTLNNFFGGSGNHWDRSNGTGQFGLSDALWVDTSTPSATFVQGASLTYTVWVAGQDATADQNGAIQIAQTTMVFPFLTSSGTNNAASGGVLFSKANGVQTDGVVWWEGTATTGVYNVKFQALTQDVGNIATGQTSLTKVGNPVTLEASISNPIGWSYANNSTALIFGYKDSSNNIFVQDFDTSGASTSSLRQIGTGVTGSWAIKDDANGHFFYFHVDTSNPNAAAVVMQTYDPATGNLGAAITSTTDVVSTSNLDARYAPSGNGTFLGSLEGTDALGNNILEANVFDGSFTAQSVNGLHITLNSSAAIHIESASLGNNGYVLAYADATTFHGSTFEVHIAQFDASGNYLGEILVPTLTGFDRLRSIGGGRFELDYRQSSTGNVVAYVYDSRTGGQTITGTSANDYLSGTTGSGNAISAGAGNDIIAPALGTTTIDGGSGFDILEIHAASTNFTETLNADGTWTISGTYSNNGVTNTYSDTVSNVETVQFTDRAISLRELDRTDVTGSGTSGMILQSGGTVVDWALAGGAYASGNVLTNAATGYTVGGAGDFNGDGTADVVLQSGGVVVDWILSNGGYQTGNVITTAATGYTVKGTGDFNGDGTGDIVLQNGGIVVDWIMKNGTYQSGNVLTTAATGYTVVGSGDFNGDGTSDLLLQSGGTVVDWIMKNGAYQTGNVITNGATGFTVVGAGDFNGDGTTDVLLQNASGTVIDWIMKNGVYQSGNTITTGAAGYTVVGTGDYNGDGTADIALQSGGTIVDWLMHNGTYQSGGVITTGATGYSVKA